MWLQLSHLWTNSTEHNSLHKLIVAQVFSESYVFLPYHLHKSPLLVHILSQIFESTFTVQSSYLCAGLSSGCFSSDLPIYILHAFLISSVGATGICELQQMQLQNPTSIQNVGTQTFVARLFRSILMSFQSNIKYRMFTKWEFAFIVQWPFQEFPRIISENN
jgi:hypothetical protein